LAVLWLVPLNSSAAQDASPGSLRQLNLQLRRDLLAAMLPEKRLFLQEVTALETRLATAQNFEGAIEARNERLRLGKEIAGLEKEFQALQAQARSLAARQLPDKIEFKMSEAVTTGLPTPPPQDGPLAGWNTAGASASWKLPSLPPGGYEVVLRYTSSGEGGVVLSEDFYSLTSTFPAAPKEPVEQNLGTLRIREGQGTLTLRANPPEKNGSLRVYSLSLMPANR
jgi:hypothetical protein